jgi:mxaD protein
MSTPHTPWRVYSTHAIFHTDPAALWRVLADFNGLPELLPEMITASSTTGEGVGAVRSLTFEGGGAAKEVLIAFHPEQFRLSYAMENPEAFPWTHYFCTQQLQALGAGQTHLVVTGYYQPREGSDSNARNVLAEVYAGVLTGLARVLNVPMTPQHS